MVHRNPNFLSVLDHYLFPEIMRRAQAFKNNNPNIELLSLSIGDTSGPLAAFITQGLVKRAEKLGTIEGYKGYCAEQGEQFLRKKIAEVFYQNEISHDEIFISDGAKCDIGRMQLLFGPEVKIAIQDPAYPVYVETYRLAGGQDIMFLPCIPENDFFPNISNIPKIDLLYLCSPNNPTGSVATHEQLREAVLWAKSCKAFIIFDAAYSSFIQDPSLPHTIYEIEGGDEVAIEISSFSKLAGFTGVRLGWTVIPKKLLFSNGHSVHQDFNRLTSTFFNGASVISQAGGMAALSSQGLQEIKTMLDVYMDNARMIRKALESLGVKVYGGVNAPYLWAYFGKHDSWDLFQTLMQSTGIIATPGSGFGKNGEGFLRFSAFGSKEHIQKAIQRIINLWPENLLSPNPSLI
jgi:LL-diaminopimelate aminotransferase